MPLQDADVTEITSRLDKVIALLGALIARDLKNNDAIVKLETMQLNREQIASAVGVTTHNVSQVLYANRKKPAKTDSSEANGPNEGVAAGELET